MKKVIIGLIIGCILSFSIAYAEDLIQVQKASFTVWINGNQFKTNKPILTLDNTAYVPVKDFSESLKAVTTWEPKDKRVYITTTPYLSQNSVFTDSFRIAIPGSRSGTRIEENKYLVSFSLRFENVGATPINIDFFKDFKLRDSEDKLVNCVSNEQQTIKPGQTKSLHLQFEVKGEDLKGYLNFIYKPSIREYSIPVFLGVDSVN